MKAAQSRIHQKIDDMAADALRDIKMHAQQVRDSIAVKIGWMIRSQAQTRRWQNARRESE